MHLYSVSLVDDMWKESSNEDTELIFRNDPRYARNSLCIVNVQSI